MDVITSAPDITKVEYMSVENQHDNNNIAVGRAARLYMENNTDLPQETLDKFFQAVRDFYEELTGKMLKKFPFHDKTLQTLGFLNPDLRQSIIPASVADLSTRFLPDLDAESVTEEFQEYCVADRKELPIYEYGESLEEFWCQMSKVKTHSGRFRYSTLSRLAFVCLCLPHSNADTERCFSLVRKVQSDYRGQLNNSTINSLLQVKLNIKAECFSYDVPKSVLEKAKQVCVVYNSGVAVRKNSSH